VRRLDRVDVGPTAAVGQRCAITIIDKLIRPAAPRPMSTSSRWKRSSSHRSPFLPGLVGSGGLWLRGCQQVKSLYDAREWSIADPVGAARTSPHGQVPALGRGDPEPGARRGRARRTAAFLPSTVELPPLRYHVEDVPALVPFFLSRLVPDGRLVCSAEAMQMLTRSSWPDNNRKIHEYGIVAPATCRRARAHAAALCSARVSSSRSGQQSDPLLIRRGHRAAPSWRRSLQAGPKTWPDSRERGSMLHAERAEPRPDRARTAGPRAVAGTSAEGSL
jgi:hypothetical protein